MAGPDPTTDVLRVFDALFETLTRERDADSGTALFADDADIVMWGSDESEQAIGPEAVGELHHALAALSGELTFRWLQRHVHVEGDAAWVNAAGDVSVQLPGEATRRTSYRMTAVFVRRGGAWRWHTFTGSEPKPS
jgi:ketosteroid isomerase-like protein